METVWWWIGGIVGGLASFYNLKMLWDHCKYLRENARIRAVLKQRNKE
jgi:hypothetical protein